MQNDADECSFFVENVPSCQQEQAEAWNDNLRFLEKLINRIRMGEDVGYGPCHFAASLGSVDMLELLLAKGADKNARDREGNCPLMWIIANDGAEELMEALVDHGASVNIQNFVGESPLFLAVQRNLHDKVSYLLENGADISTRNLDGAGPLHAAAANGDIDVISLLVKYGAHVNATDDEGDSPLHWAVREGQTKAAYLLGQLGADANLKNEDDESPLDLATCIGELAMAKNLAFSQTKGSLGLSDTNMPFKSLPELIPDEQASGFREEAKDAMRGSGQTVSFAFVF